MNLLNYILIAIIVYIVYKTIHDNMPSQKISKLESKAYEYFTEIFEDSKKTIKDYEEKLEKGEKSILGEGHNERIIKNTKEYLDKL